MKKDVDEIDIMEVKSEDLWDIDKIDITMEDTREEKALQFMAQTNGGVRTHINGEYTVRVHFSDTDYTAADAISDYLKEIAELKY